MSGAVIAEQYGVSAASGKAGTAEDKKSRGDYACAMGVAMEIVTGRIERLAVDAVVNAANRMLLPGGGVDGALRRAAGPQLTWLTDTMPPLAEGEAVITPGFSAPARWIIHTAAPVWFAAGAEDEKIATLSACYRNCLLLADARTLASIAFPCLGTGAFGWPRERACAIALETVRRTLPQTSAIRSIVFCCFSEDDGALYEAALSVS